MKKIGKKLIIEPVKLYFEKEVTTVQISRKPTLAEYPAVYPIFDEMVH